MASRNIRNTGRTYDDFTQYYGDMGRHFDSMTEGRHDVPVEYERPGRGRSRDEGRRSPLAYTPWGETLPRFFEGRPMGEYGPRDYEGRYYQGQPLGEYGSRYYEGETGSRTYTPRSYEGRPAGDYDGVRLFARPGCELVEFDGEYVCTMYLPGFEKSDIECTYEDGCFYVDARREGREGADAVWMRRPFRVSERVYIPRDVDAEEISATYRCGMLEVRLPFAPRSSGSGHSISIRD
ncbi:Hsp20/alpha crystallin family protein [Haloarchaeobius sp. TZWWS8]|uniref:Hsp20/alpha crystallin family protein n=1 Tax=Haloarchaeobius sp. TZWWS8 TaxID=3446121 RepID=UPI003EB9E9A5